MKYVFRLRVDPIVNCQKIRVSDTSLVKEEVVHVNPSLVSQPNSKKSSVAGQ